MPTQSSAQPAQLFHSPSSYYSMIARLALTESGRPFTLTKVDIHRRMAQFEPSYVRINPHMTVPALVLPGRTIADSRDILTWAYGDQPFGPQVEDMVARQYRFAIDELTFSCLLRANPIARKIIPGKLARTRDRLIALAAANPDLADLYRQRSEVFAHRVRTFDPRAVAALFDTRWAQAAAELAWLESVLADGRRFLCGDTYGPADVVWTVFLARMRFIRRGAEVERLPSLRRYEADMRARPSFAAADVWPSVNIFKLIKQML